VSEEEVKKPNNARVHASAKAVVNMGDFNSLHIELGYEVDVPEGVSRQNAMNSLRTSVEAEMTQWLNEVKAERDGK